MITELRKFLLLETLGINDNVIKLSKYIFDIIKDKKVNKITIPFYFYGIKTIIINYKKIKNTHSNFNFEDSNKDEIYLNISNINKYDIEHELNHALQFIKTNKEKVRKQSSEYRALLLTNNDLEQNDIFEKLIAFRYFSQKYELDSLIYNIKEDVSNLLDLLIENNKINKYNFNQHFKSLLIESETFYMIDGYLNKFNPKILKKLNNKELSLMLRVFNENKDFLSKNKLCKINILFNKFKKIFLSNNQIPKIDINEYINKLEKDKNEYQNYFNKKVDKIYAYIYDLKF